MGSWLLGSRLLGSGFLGSWLLGSRLLGSRLLRISWLLRGRLLRVCGLLCSRFLRGRLLRSGAASLTDLSLRTVRTGGTFVVAADDAGDGWKWMGWARGGGDALAATVVVVAWADHCWGAGGVWGA